MTDRKRIKKKLLDLPPKEQSSPPRLPGEPTKREDLNDLMPALVEAKYLKGATYQELCDILHPDIIISTSTLHRYLTEYYKIHGLPQELPERKAEPPLARNKEEEVQPPAETEPPAKNLTAAQRIRMKHKHLYSQPSDNEKGGVK
jgi:hypothetical protein